MTNVYIETRRLIPVGWADARLEEILIKNDISNFKQKHPIIGSIFSGLVTNYFTYQGKEKYKPMSKMICE